MRQNMQLAITDRDRDLAFADMEAPEQILGVQHTNMIQRIHLLLRGRYKWAMALAMVGAACGAVLGWRAGNKLHMSIGQIRVVPVLPTILKQLDENGPMAMFDQFVETQTQLIHSQRVMDMAMENEGWQAMRRGNSVEAAAEFSKSLTVSRRGELINVHFADLDPTATQAAVKAVIDAYNKIHIEGDVKSGEKRLELLQAMLTNLQSDLGAKRQQILALSQQLATGDLEATYQAKTTDLNKIDSERNELELKLAQVATVLPTTRPAAAPAPTQARELTMEDLEMRFPAIARALEVKRDAERRLKEARANGRMENHPEIKEYKNRIAAATEEAEDAAKKARRLIDQGLVTASAGPISDADNPDKIRTRLALVTELYEKKRKEVMELSLQRVKVEELKQQEEVTKSNLAEVRTRIDQLSVESKMTGRITLISDGDRPFVFKDDRTTLAGAGGIGGIGLGFGIVLLIGLMDRRFRSPEDARASMSSNPMLGILPNLPDDLADPAQAALTAHFVHQIRTLLQIWEGSREKQVFSITSPVSGTGKTSLTLALGVSFAAADSKTLVIDCDVIGGGLTARANTIVRRKIGRILTKEGLVTENQLAEALKLASGNRARLGEVLVELGYLKEEDVASALVAQQKASVGLLDVIGGETLEDCVAETGIPNLSILPLGSATAQHASKLSPLAVRRVIDACRKRYDTILIDTGPVPGSLEASVVAAQVDGVILCVSRGEQRPLAEKSVQHLLSIGAKVAGVVFNRAKSEDMTVYSTTLRTSMPQDGSAMGGGVEQSSRFGPMARAVASSGAGTGLNADGLGSGGNGNGIGTVGGGFNAGPFGPVSATTPISSAQAASNDDVSTPTKAAS